MERRLSLQDTLCPEAGIWAFESQARGPASVTGRCPVSLEFVCSMLGLDTVTYLNLILTLFRSTSHLYKHIYTQPPYEHKILRSLRQYNLQI